MQENFVVVQPLGEMLPDFPLDGPVEFSWDQDLSRVPVRNFGRVLTVGIRALGFKIPKGLYIAVHPILNKFLLLIVLKRSYF